MFRFLLSTSVCAWLCLATANAYSVGMPSSMTSAFGGRVLVTGTTNGASMEMKKGKANVPPQMRGQYKKQQEMAQMRQQMIAASQPGADGLPVFNLFVRTKKANVSFVEFDPSLLFPRG